MVASLFSFNTEPSVTFTQLQENNTGLRTKRRAVRPILSIDTDLSYR